MKKTLLTIALAAGAFAAANAQSTFEVLYEGQTIADGATITCKEYSYEPGGEDEYGPYDPLLQFNCDIRIDGTTDETVNTMSWWEDVDMTTPDGPTQMCYAEYSSEGKFLTGSCVSAMDKLEGTPLEIKAKGDGWKVWQLHVTYNADPSDPRLMGDNISKFRIMNAENTDEVISFRINFTTNGTVGSVDGIAAEDAAPEYFNLQGVRVAEPQNGIYIVRRGSKVTKEVVRR